MLNNNNENNTIDELTKILKENEVFNSINYEKNNEYFNEAFKILNDSLINDNNLLINKIKLLEEKINKIENLTHISISIESIKNLYLCSSIILGLLSLCILIKYKKLQKRIRIQSFLIKNQFEALKNMRREFKKHHNIYINESKKETTYQINYLKEQTQILQNYKTTQLSFQTRLSEHIQTLIKKNKITVKEVIAKNLQNIYASLILQVKLKIETNSKILFKETFFNTKHYTNDTMRLAYAFSFLITSHFLLNLGVDETYLTEFDEIIKSKQFIILNKEKTLIGLDDIFITTSENIPIEFKFHNEDYLMQNKKNHIKNQMLSFNIKN